MTYPANAEYKAVVVGVDSALQSRLLNGVTDLEGALALLDDVSAIGERIAFNLLTHAPDVVTAGVWARVAAAVGYLYRSYYGNDGSQAQNDEIRCNFYIPAAGTYAFTMQAPTMSDACIVKLYIDGVQIGLTSGYDLYTAALGPYATIGVSGLVLTAGAHVVRFLCFDKNAASSAYGLRLGAMSFKRTA